MRALSASAHLLLAGHDAGLLSVHAGVSYAIDVKDKLNLQSSTFQIIPTVPPGLSTR
jgi:hypothetical protein